ncbi:MAG: type II CAAX endopeptidase family protein [Bacillota bacterium]|nr:type II CAAX endopeptidase family protein [Bacillota bacterium]
MEKENFRRDVRRIGEVLLIFVFLQLFWGFVLSILFNGVLKIENVEVSMGLIELVASLIAGAGSYYYGKARLHIQFSKDFNSFPKKEIINSLSLMIFLSTIVNIGLILIKEIWMRLTGFTFYTPDFSMSSSRFYNLCLIISTLVIAPIFEELIFRGLILRTLSKYSKTLAIVLSGVLFGMLHMNIEQAIPTMVIGMLFAYVSLKNNTLYLPIVLHFINNAIAFLALNVSGLEMIISYFEFGMMVLGGVTFFSRIKEVIRKVDFYPHTVEIWKQWTMVVFGVLFLIFGIGSLFNF